MFWGGRSSRQRLSLKVDLCGIPLQADGGDFVPVVAQIIDKRGEVVRLTEDTIRFSVSGPAELIGVETMGINPQKLIFGEAVILVRAGIEPGEITVRAESACAGICKPLAGEITIESAAPGVHQCFRDVPEIGQKAAQISESQKEADELKTQVDQLTAELNEFKVAIVEKQQEERM